MKSLGYEVPNRTSEHFPTAVAEALPPAIAEPVSPMMVALEKLTE